MRALTRRHPPDPAEPASSPALGETPRRTGASHARRHYSNASPATVSNSARASLGHCSSLAPLSLSGFGPFSFSNVATHSSSPAALVPIRDQSALRTSSSRCAPISRTSLTGIDMTAPARSVGRIRFGTVAPMAEVVETHDLRLRHRTAERGLPDPSRRRRGALCRGSLLGKGPCRCRASSERRGARCNRGQWPHHCTRLRGAGRSRRRRVVRS